MGYRQMVEGSEASRNLLPEPLPIGEMGGGLEGGTPSILQKMTVAKRLTFSLQSGEAR